MDDSKCVLHATVLGDIRKDFEVFTETINKSIETLAIQIRKNDTVTIRNGGGLMVTVSTTELQQNIYDGLKEVKESIANSQLTSDKVIGLVEENIEDIMFVCSKFEKKQSSDDLQIKKQKIELTNNKMQLIQYILFFLSILTNVFLIVHSKL